MTKSILFVRGFATQLSSGIDDYMYIKVLLEREYKFTYFDYEPSEDLDVVYNRLLNALQSVNMHPDIIIAHSLGGGLIAKYIKTMPKTVIDGHEKIILLMPLICKNIINDFASNFQFIPNILIPKSLFLPASYLFDVGNLLNNDNSLISFKQPFVLYNDPSYAISNDVSFIKNNKNVTLFYASDEKLNMIDESVLSTIPKKQLKRVSGLHNCWRSIQVNKTLETDFFTQFINVLDEK
jgi:hypothetical protein